MLDGPHPRVFLSGERCKGKRDASRSDFCAELAAWVVEASSPLFTIPRDIAKELRRDLKTAGIPYRDERGWVFDFHASRK